MCWCVCTHTRMHTHSIAACMLLLLNKLLQLWLTFNALLKVKPQGQVPGPSFLLTWKKVGQQYEGKVILVFLTLRPFLGIVSVYKKIRQSQKKPIIKQSKKMFLKGFLILCRNPPVHHFTLIIIHFCKGRLFASIFTVRIGAGEGELAHHRGRRRRWTPVSGHRSRKQTGSTVKSTSPRFGQFGWSTKW